MKPFTYIDVPDILIAPSQMKNSLNSKGHILRQTENRYRYGPLPGRRQQIQVMQTINGRLCGQGKILLPAMVALDQLASDEIVYDVELSRRVQDRALAHGPHHVGSISLDFCFVVDLVDVGLPAARGGVSLVPLVFAGFQSAQEGHVDYLQTNQQYGIYSRN